MQWKTTAVIFALPVIAITLWLYVEPGVPSKTTKRVPPVPVNAGIPFEKTGALMRDNPGLEPNTWYLSYEEPGAPGLTAALVFTAESRCGSVGSLMQCRGSFNPGQRVRIVGFMHNGTVSVHALMYESDHADSEPRALGI